MAPSSTRRVSYVVPSPSNGVPKLRLPPEDTPRNGQISPILLLAENSGSDQLASNTNGSTKKSRYPRHRLGVATFALDSATQLVDRDSPEGILYSGGRDGMIMAWDLGMPMKRRAPRFGAPVPSGTRRMGRWERLTVDEDEDNAIYEEDDDEWPTSDGDVIGDVLGSSHRRGSRYWAQQRDVPYEQRWEIDVNHVESGQPAYFKKHVQAHTDWVNDLLLCNLNQTVVSGSSDGTVKAWNPHSSNSYLPSTIGTHSDYVRCLAQCHERKWVASGSFDRTVKLWDIAQPRADPVMTLLPPETAGPKTSVYALASDPYGHVVAAGGPERVVRTWDPRSGKRTGKLVGHTDNIRAILMSEDSRYLLTGSADASIKLWSILSPQRCIYTFTHHTESVWSLFSSHPGLEVFYSGDRSGLVSRVDVEECSRVSQGECTLLCKDTGEPSMASSEGVSKIIAMDDHLVWTATGSSSIRRWRVPQSRITRAASSSPIDESSSQRLINRHISISSVITKPSSSPDSPSFRRIRGESLTPSISASFISHASSEFETDDNALNGIPYVSLVKLSAPNASHGAFSITPRGREAEVSTMYSAASARSAPRRTRSPPAGAFPGSAYIHSQGRGSISTYVAGRRDTLSPPVQDGVIFALPNARMAYEDRDVAPDAIPLAEEPDLIIEGEHGLVRVLIMNDRMHALTVNAVGVVAVWDIVRCQCLGVFAQEDVQNASRRGTSSLSSGGGGADSAENRISPRQALEIVRDRIEGEAVVNPWSNADTRIGELAIQILDRCFESEIFADEAGYGPERSYSDDHRINIGKWVLRNLFMGFIREEQRLAAKHAHEKSVPSAYKSTPAQRSHSHGHPRASSESSAGDRTLGTSSAALDVPPVPVLPADLASGAMLHRPGLSPIAQSPVGSGGSDNIPTPRPANYMQSNLGGAPFRPDEATPVASAPTASAGGGSTHPASPSTATTPSATTTSGSHDYFSLRRRPSTSQSTSTAHTTAGLADDDFSGWGGPGSVKGSTTHDTAPSTPSTPGGGLMGRLKNLGKGSRRAATEFETHSTSVPSTSDTTENNVEGHGPPSPPKTLIERLQTQPIIPPSSHEAPLLTPSSETTIIVSEELTCGWSPMYRGTVGSVGPDATILEEVLPDWLLEFLLANKAPPVPTAKISFVLLPAQIHPEAREVYGETLPELLNSSQSKLSASKFLRVKKLAYHVQEKLDKNAQSKPSSPRSSTDTNSNGGRSSLNLGTSSSHDGTSSPTTSRASTPRLSSNMQLHGHVHGVPRAEDVYEILCNEQVLPLDMTLAAVRQFVWRQAGELVMSYRRKPRRDSTLEASVA